MYAGAIYDAIYLYAIALNETLAAGGDKKDGQAIVHRMLNMEFEGSCLFDTEIAQVPYEIRNLCVIELELVHEIEIFFEVERNWVEYMKSRFFEEERNWVECMKSRFFEVKRNWVECMKSNFFEEERNWVECMKLRLFKETPRKQRKIIN